MIKAVLFDFNGTLFFDTFIHIASWTKYCKIKFDKDLTLDEFFNHINGRSNFDIIPYLTNNKFNSKEDIDNCVIEKCAIYQQMVRDLRKEGNIDLVKGSYQLFDFLNKNNIPFTIVTSSRSYNVDFYYEIFNLAKYLDRDKIVCDMGKLKGKPNPDFYLYAAEQLGVDIKDTIILEDSFAGLQSAFSTSCYEVIGVDNNENEDELMAYPLKTIVKNMEQVISYIKKENSINDL